MNKNDKSTSPTESSGPPGAGGKNYTKEEMSSMADNTIIGLPGANSGVAVLPEAIIVTEHSKAAGVERTPRPYVFLDDHVPSSHEDQKACLDILTGGNATTSPAESSGPPDATSRGLGGLTADAHGYFFPDEDAGFSIRVKNDCLDILTSGGATTSPAESSGPPGAGGRNVSLEGSPGHGKTPASRAADKLFPKGPGDEHAYKTESMSRLASSFNLIFNTGPVDPAKPSRKPPSP